MLHNGAHDCIAEAACVSSSDVCSVLVARCAGLRYDCGGNLLHCVSPITRQFPPQVGMQRKDTVYSVRFCCVLEVLHPGNIQGDIRMDTDMSQCKLIANL